MPSSVADLRTALWQYTWVYDVTLMQRSMPPAWRRWLLTTKWRHRHL